MSRTLNAGIKSAVKFTFCAAVSAGDSIASLLGADSVTPSGIQDAIDRYRMHACGADPASDLTPVGTPPPFTGGQCSQQLYNVTFEHGGVADDGTILGNPTPTTFANVPGKIGVRYGNADGSEPFKVFVTFNDGAAANFVFLTENQYFYQGKHYGGEFFSFVVTKSDGSSDDCGDLPTELPDATDEQDYLVDVEYDAPDGSPVTLPDVPLKFFKPCINIDGIRIPFELQTPFGKVCGKIGIAPDFPDIIEPSLDIDLCPDQKQSIGISETEVKDYFELLPALGDAVNFPDLDYDGQLTQTVDLEAPPILGAFIRGRSSGAGTGGKTVLLNAEGATNPNIIIPRIGTIFFECLVKTENGYQTAFSEDIPIKNVDQLIRCPWEFGAVAVHFRKEIGWDFAVFPITRKSCCDSCKSNDPNEDLDKLNRCHID